jgi:hypothetical protein
MRANFVFTNKLHNLMGSTIDHRTFLIMMLAISRKVKSWLHSLLTGNLLEFQQRCHHQVRRLEIILQLCRLWNYTSNILKKSSQISKIKWILMRCLLLRFRWMSYVMQSHIVLLQWILDLKSLPTLWRRILLVLARFSNSTKDLLSGKSQQITLKELKFRQLVNTL